MNRQTLRIIDANLNRAAEGLRFLEEITRLVLNDDALTQQLKTMRHDLIRADAPFNLQLLDARDSVRDVGIDLKVRGEKKNRDLTLTIIANSRRAQESMRVLEETAKMPGVPLDSEQFKHARFTLYTIEKDILARLTRKDRQERITGLYAIIDDSALKGRRHIDVATQIIKGGAKIIQLRDKTLSKRELLPIAEQIRAVCSEKGVLFFVCDDIDLALAISADGVHLEPDSLPAKVVRKLLPMDMLLGVSVRSLKEAIAAQKDGADYVSLCPSCIAPSGGKIYSLEELSRLHEKLSIPLVAIGGVKKENVTEVISAGASAVAAVSAILEAEDIERATRQMVRALKVKK